MKKVIVFRNEDIERVLLGVPQGHKHNRLIIVTKDLVLVFQEATLANICRAYITLITHPQIKALELKREKLKVKKKGYAEYQLLETSKKSEDIINEITQILNTGDK